MFLSRSWYHSGPTPLPHTMAYIKYLPPPGQDHRETVTGTQTLWSKEIIGSPSIIPSNGLEDTFTHDTFTDETNQTSPLSGPK
jgi:hypothetical protein